MNQSQLNTTLIFSTLILSLSACKPTDNSSEITSSESVIISVSDIVIAPTYNDMASKATILEAAVISLKNNPTQANLDAARQLWKDTRKAWEQSEGFLFGPVATEDIDPSIDTWPVNYADLDSVLASSETLSLAYLSSLTQDALRGFHPLEYLLWGTNGTKQAADFTSREKEYMVALAGYIKLRSSHVAERWDASNADAFIHDFKKAGNGSTLYTTRKDAMLELVGAMQTICEEVAEGKIGEPFAALDPSLEESPYSGNSMEDFTNNMRSIRNVYNGSYTSSGKGIRDFVKSYNLSLNSEIETKINAAIAALENVTLPFGQAIFSQPQQIATAQTAIRDLNTVLGDKLVPMIQQKVID